MRAIVLKALTIAALIFASAAFAQKPKIAVYVSEHSGYSEEAKSALRTATLNTLVRSGRYEVVERTNVLDMELMKQASGAVDDDQLVAFGRQAGVRYVCISDMLSPFGTRYVERRMSDKNGNAYTVRDPYVDFQVSARIIDVETAEVVALGVKTLSNITSGQSFSVAIVSAVDEMLKTVVSDKLDSGMPKMAVYVYGHRANDGAGQTLYTYVLNALFTRSRYNGDFMVVERAEAFTRQIDREQLKQHSGIVDDGQISRLGRQYGIEHIVVANIDYAMNTYNISARVVNVQTASVTDASNLYHYSNGSSMEDYRVIAVSMVEDMIKRKRTEAEIQAERAEIEAERDAEQTGWRVSGSIGGGISLMMDSVDTLYKPIGGQFFFNVEFLKSNVHFLRVGMDLNIIGLSEISDSTTDSTTEMFANGKVSAFVKLCPIDAVYLSGGGGLNWYRARPAAPVFSVGAGLVIPITDDIVFGKIFIEAQYNMVLLKNRTAGYWSINAGLHTGRGALLKQPERQKKEVI